MARNSHAALMLDDYDSVSLEIHGRRVYFTSCLANAKAGLMLMLMLTLVIQAKNFF